MYSLPVLETAGLKPGVGRTGFFCGHEGDYIPGPCPIYWKTQVSLIFLPVPAPVSAMYVGCCSYLPFDLNK